MGMQTAMWLRKMRKDSVKKTAEIMLMGIAQDAGLPQVGCHCANCEAVVAGRLAPETAVSMAVIDGTQARYWIVDATPDIRVQMALVAEHYPQAELAGILLTHAHIGHYTGLMFLGRESSNAKALPVWASATLCDFIRRHAPWQQLVELGNIELHEVTPDTDYVLSETVSFSGTLVPHRGEYSDTLAFSLQGKQDRVFYCPDIDRWSDWNKDVREVVMAHQISFLDATFFSADELPGRDLSTIPHPLVTDTVERLAHCPAEVVLIHLNHSNPLYQPGPALDWVKEMGLTVGATGQRWSLA